MKIFAIRDESTQEQKDLAYLLYYKQEKQFYIELPENADAWETPLLLDSFVKRRETTVNSYWSKIWVQQRIVPIDRQNIGEILRDNHLKEYDEYELLMLAMGRCAQDDYYLVPINEKELPEEITRRFSKRIEDVLPLENHCLLVFFRDGVVKKCDLQKHFEKTKTFQEAGLFSVCTDADRRIRCCLGCEHDHFGHDALPNWQKCSADDGRLPELCCAQNYQRIGSGGDIRLLPAEHH